MGAVITVEQLGKKYLISHQRGRFRGTTFRENTIRIAQGAWHRLRHPLSPNRQTTAVEEMWALKDVSFEVREGERLGIIGRNGAGKSTLLKILSRITHPTTGRVRLRGRVSSLLEVGTGFHPELTGRENIFLNGAILGMGRHEIKSKFDEIVAFAEVERFLDTPVKRYSSGMYVRLAFAVAAHLEPEILIVDEVLAVGDAAFQKKCLGKMENVAQEGRTVLFVSHNMGAIAGLCTECMWLVDGQLRVIGPSDRTINDYLTFTNSSQLRKLSSRTDRVGNGAVRFVDFSLSRSPHGPSTSDVFLGDEIFMQLKLISGRKAAVWIGMTINDRLGRKLMHTSTRMHGTGPHLVDGQMEIVLRYPKFLLGEGRYSIDLSAWTTNPVEVADSIEGAAEIEVLPSDLYGSGCTIGSYFGAVQIPHEWISITEHLYDKTS